MLPDWWLVPLRSHSPLCLWAGDHCRGSDGGPRHLQQPPRGRLSSLRRQNSSLTRYWRSCISCQDSSFRHWARTLLSACQHHLNMSQCQHNVSTKRYIHIGLESGPFHRESPRKSLDTIILSYLICYWTISIFATQSFFFLNLILLMWTFSRSWKCLRESLMRVSSNKFKAFEPDRADE